MTPEQEKKYWEAYNSPEQEKIRVEAHYRTNGAYAQWKQGTESPEVSTVVPTMEGRIAVALERIATSLERLEEGFSKLNGRS